MRLGGRVAIVPVGGTPEAIVERLAAEGATIVLVAGDGGGEEAGRLASMAEAQGGRPAVFDGDDIDGLIEFVNELFRP